MLELLLEILFLLSLILSFSSPWFQFSPKPEKLAVFLDNSLSMNSYHDQMSLKNSGLKAAENIFKLAADTECFFFTTADLPLKSPPSGISGAVSDPGYYRYPSGREDFSVYLDEYRDLLPPDSTAYIIISDFRNNNFSAQRVHPGNFLLLSAAGSAVNRVKNIGLPDRMIFNSEEIKITVDTEAADEIFRADLKINGRTALLLSGKAGRVHKLLNSGRPGLNCAEIIIPAGDFTNSYFFAFYTSGRKKIRFIGNSSGRRLMENIFAYDLKRGNLSFTEQNADLLIALPGKPADYNALSADGGIIFLPQIFEPGEASALLSGIPGAVIEIGSRNNAGSFGMESFRFRENQIYIGKMNIFSRYNDLLNCTVNSYHTLYYPASSSHKTLLRFENNDPAAVLSERDGKKYIIFSFDPSRGNSTFFSVPSSVPLLYQSLYMVCFPEIQEGTALSEKMGFMPVHYNNFLDTGIFTNARGEILVLNSDPGEFSPVIEHKELKKMFPGSRTADLENYEKAMEKLLSGTGGMPSAKKITAAVCLFCIVLLFAIHIMKNKINGV